MKQATLKQSLIFEGIGIHSGLPCKVILEPAPQDHGLVFIKDGQKIFASASNVKDTRRGTTLGDIIMVEHLLAALSGLGISNARLTVSGREVPALDGSSLPYVSAIQKDGIQLQSAEVFPITLTKEIKVDAPKGFISACPADRFEVDFMIELPVVGVQRSRYDGTPESFAADIAPARTFGFQDELEALQKSGLGKGASLENALAIGKSGYLNEPRFADEPVRHKILDVIGDLCLLGRPLKARITAERTGHPANIELARRILCSI